MVDPSALPEDAPTIADGRYVLVNRIGEGGMAGVYKAWDTRLRVWRAVKVLFPKFAKKRKLRTRFEAEAHTMARLEHVNLVRIYDVGDTSTLPFIVMELVLGGTLIHWTLLNGPMPPRMAVDAILQLCYGVQAVHRGGIVHRDIKPHNVLIGTDGTCKLTDFGIAQGANDGLTKTGSTMGTLGYMAPEQRNDAKSVDRRADIYSIGATLWHVLNAEQVVDLFMCDENPKLLQNVPEPLRPVIVRAVAYKRDDRYPDVEALITDLHAARAQLDDDPPYTPPLPLDEAAISDHGAETDYPEIRLVLDGVDTGLSDEPHTGEAPLRPPSNQAQPKVLPYYMPSSGGDDTHKSLTQRRAEPEDDLPDWVDRSSYDGGDDGFTIGVDPSLVRSEEEVQAELERQQAEADPRETPMSGYGAAPRVETEAEAEAEVEVDVRSEPGAAPAVDQRSRYEAEEGADESDEPDWIAAEDRQPRRPVQATPPPAPAPAEETSRAMGIAGALTVPLAGLLVVGILFVVGLVSVLGFGAYQMYGTASAATESRSQLYALLRSDAKQVIAQVADPGAQRTELEASYLDWYEAQGEPVRSAEAAEFLDDLAEVADRRLASAEGTQSLQEAQQTMRRIRAARTQYQRDMEAWEGRADGTLGSIVIAMGIGTAPPR